MRTTEANYLSVSGRYKAEGDAGKFSGYAAVFGNEDAHGEVILPGAFKASLAAYEAEGSKPGLFYQHPRKYGQQPMPIGVLTVIKEDEIGLYVEGEINLNTTLGRDVWALMKQRALEGLSIGFLVSSDGIKYDADNDRFLIVKADLFEVSVVERPANSLSKIAEFKAKAGDVTERDLERLLRDAGLSAKEAKRAISKVKVKENTSMDQTQMQTRIKRLHKQLQDVTREAWKEEQVKGYVTSALKEQQDKIIADLEKAETQYKERIDALEDKLAKLERPNIAGNGTEDNAAYKEAFDNYIRRGIPIPADVAADFYKSFEIEDPGTAGVAVPHQIDQTIYNLVVEISPMQQLASTVTVGTPNYSKIVNTRGTASGWVGETDERTETAAPALAEIKPPMGEIYALPFASRQSLEDVFFNVEDWLAGEVATEFAAKMGAAFVTGDGTDKPKGFLAYTQTAEKDGVRAFGSIQAHSVEDPTGFGLTPDELLIDVVHSMKPTLRAGAVWLTNSLTLGQLRKLRDENGNLLLVPDFRDGLVNRLLGYPVHEDPAMPDIAADNVSLAFGNFKRGYLIVNRRGILTLRDELTNKPYVGFYSTMRVGGGVVDSEAIKLVKHVDPET